MKKLSLVLALAIVALLFASCKKENKLEQQIIGKWMIADMNGQSMQTNEKKVYTFVSATKAYVSASLNSNPDIASIWDVEMEAVTDREFQKYFVDGTLLATRWKVVGENELREWWEVASIAGDQMEWTALRKNEDGTTVQQGMKWVKVN